MTGQGRGPSDRGYAGESRGWLTKLGLRTKARTPVQRIALSADLPGFERPLCADWLWRPDPWIRPCFSGPVPVEGSGQNITPGVSLFHDATAASATIAHTATPEADAPYGLSMDVGAFDGSFLSLALDLPADGIAGISRRHLLGVSFRLEAPPAAKVFARFNLRHGPNTETLLRALPETREATGRIPVEFDLAYIEMNERRVTAAWIDVIFQQPAQTGFRIDDLVLYRRPRAQL
ncbi:DUF6478 family protein [Tropicimonas aquimaris]|uniref:DUF6478 family protein n=1 Tax=Tropicimonas aquimaris TaxID=914152 RepID=A0ABW3IX81_9RHOB